MKTWTLLVEITKRGAPKSCGWKCKMPSWIRKELHFYVLLAYDSKILRTCVKDRKTKSARTWATPNTEENIRPSSAVTTRRFTSLRRPEKERYHTACKCCLSNCGMSIKIMSIYKNKASHHRQRQCNCRFLLLFYLLSPVLHNFCLRNKYSVFYRSVVSVENLRSISRCVLSKWV